LTESGPISTMRISSSTAVTSELKYLDSVSESVRPRTMALTKVLEFHREVELSLFPKSQHHRFP
nr:hypothetical protein [Tanacetum cinerariifolium]